MTAIGVGAFGFGVLLLLSAYTNTPMFGEKGLLRELLQTGDAREYGKAVGSAMERLAAEAAKKVPAKTGMGAKPAGTVPPSSNGGTWT